MESEVTTIFSHLTKDGLGWKPTEITTELKTMVSKPIPNSLSLNNHETAIINDFMGYARKILIEKQNLKIYND